MASVHCFGSSMGRTRPVCCFDGSWRMTSFGPPWSVAMTGIPEAWDSMTTCPRVSVVEGKANMSEDA